MRKYILGLTVAAIFLMYSMVLRGQHSGPVVPASSPSQANSSGVPNTSVANSSDQHPKYADGTYTGNAENAYYGNVQISATITNGMIAVINFLEFPNENPNSQYVNQQAMPYLKQEAIKAQSSNVSIVTGATFTSQAFIESLASALNQAKQS